MQTRFKNTNNRSDNLKYYKPTSPGRHHEHDTYKTSHAIGFRGRVVVRRDELYKGDPYKPLTSGLSKTGYVARAPISIDILWLLGELCL